MERQMKKISIIFILLLVGCGAEKLSLEEKQRQALLTTQFALDNCKSDLHSYQQGNYPRTPVVCPWWGCR